MEKVEDGILSLDNALFFDEVASQLSSGRTVTIGTSGRSMLPFIVGGRDCVVLRRCGRVRRGDIVLARSGRGCLLHRVYGVRGGMIVLMGDGNLHAREQCRIEDVLGRAETIIRGGGRKVDCLSPSQRWLAALWRIALPARRVLLPLCLLFLGRNAR